MQKQLQEGRGEEQPNLGDQSTWKDMGGGEKEKGTEEMADVEAHRGGEWAL